MSQLFTPFSLGDLELKNRFIRSATTSYWSNEEGILTDPILSYYEKLAKGNIGLIIKGHSYVSEKGKAHTRQSGLCSEKHIPKMKELTKIVHSFGSRILAQLNHGGYTCKQDRATASLYKTEKWTARALAVDEIEQIIEDFSLAAEFALQADFDGIQIHAAHGYLLSQFLSDNVNKREDKYGGSLKNRAKFLLDVYSEIRKKVGKEVVIGVKLNTDDFAKEKGIQIGDSILVGTWLSEKGIDFIELSGGGPLQDSNLRKKRGRAQLSSYSEATWGAHAKKFREKVQSIPLSLVDGIRSKKTMETLLDEGIVDLVSMSKPFICEPNFVSLLEKGQGKSSCVDCTLCISRKYFGKTMLRCFHLEP
ncbi:MAG: oxidoreductase [Candidatus Heimdallarchaeaceae archaeon]